MCNPLINNNDTVREMRRSQLWADVKEFGLGLFLAFLGWLTLFIVFAAKEP